MFSSNGKMPLESRQLDVPFQTGLSQKVDPRQLQVGSQTTIVNAVFSKAGALDKRWGYTAIPIRTQPNADNLAVGKALRRVGNTPVLIGTGSTLPDLIGISGYNDAHRYFVYSPSSGAAAGSWSDLGPISECNAWRENIVEWPQQTNCFDIAYANGFAIVAWSALPPNASVFSVYVTVYDLTNGARVISNFNIGLAGGSYPAVRVVGVGTSAVVLYKDGITATDLYANVLNLTTLTWSGATKIISDFDQTTNMQLWDASAVVGSTNNFVIVYPFRVLPRISSKVVFCDTTPSVIGSALFGPPVGHNSPGHAYAVHSVSGENTWIAVAYDDGVNTDIYVSARSATSALTSVLAETPMFTGIQGTASLKLAITRYSATQAHVVYSGRAPPMVWGMITTAGVVSGTNRVLNQHILAGKPFVYDGLAYCLAACTANLVAYTDIPPTVQLYPQGAYVLVELSGYASSVFQSARPVAYLAPRIANTTSNAYSSVLVVTNTPMISATRFMGIGTVTTSTTRFALQSLTFDFAGDRWQHAELGEATYVSGGILCESDAQRCVEVGFLHPPPTVNIAQSQGAGLLTANGSYTYYVMYQWTDAKGQIQRSASAIGSFTLTGANNTLTLTISALALTLKQNAANGFSPAVGVQIYRNTAGGSTFYQLLSDAAALTTIPTTSTLTFVDTTSDSSLVGLGYGVWPYSGGLVEGYPPSAILHLAAHNDRLYGVSDDRITLVFSTKFVTGEQVRFNDAFRIPIPEGGPITAIASMDGALIVFKSDSVFLVVGDGPNDAATQSDLPTPVRIPSDVGCIDSRSVCVTPEGIYFQSRTGIYLMTRGSREMVYVGSAVETVLSTYPVIKAVTLVGWKNEIRFACCNAESSTTGVTIVYNYFFKAWSVFDRFDPDGNTSLTPSASEIAVNGSYYWMTNAGRVYLENSIEAANSHTDAGHWVTMSVSTAMVKANGIAGWGRWRYVNALIQERTPIDLVLNVSTDYGTTFSEACTFRHDEIATWTTALPIAKHQIGAQKSPTCMIQLSDALPHGAPVGSGRGATFIGLTLDYGVYPKGYRVPYAQSK